MDNGERFYIMVIILKKRKRDSISISKRRKELWIIQIENDILMQENITFIQFS